MGICIDFEIGGGSALNLLRKRSPRALAYKFNGMQVDLQRRAEFDRWFETEMVEAPQQMHLWKRHFDRWSNKRMADTLAAEDLSDQNRVFAKGFFDEVMSQLKDSEELEALIGSLDQAVEIAVTNNEEKIPDEFE